MSAKGIWKVSRLFDCVQPKRFDISRADQGCTTANYFSKLCENLDKQEKSTHTFISQLQV